MSSQVLTPSEIDVTKFTFGQVKSLESGSKMVSVFYEGNPLIVELPSLSVPFGVNVFDKNGPPKFSADFSFRGADDNDAIREAQEFLESFDERMVDAGVTNAAKWLKMAPNREVIKAIYTPSLRYSKDAEGNLKPYPPTFKAPLKKRKDGSFETDFYNAAERDEKGGLQKFPEDMSVEQILSKRTWATPIVQCTGIWIAGSKFGVTWKALQIRVDSQPNQIRGPAFRSDAPDIRSFVSKEVAKGAGVSAAHDVIDDGDAEDDVVAAVLPPPVAARKAPAPAPVPTFEDDEAVMEPVALPARKPAKVGGTKVGAPKKA